MSKLHIPAYRYGVCPGDSPSYGVVTLDQARYEAGSYDGDTTDVIIDIPVDVGFRFTVTATLHYRLRLHSIDAPELRGSTREAGIASRNWLRQKLLAAMDLGVETFKEGKYGGRYIAIIYADRENVNQAMVDAGMAVAKDYK